MFASVCCLSFCVWFSGRCLLALFALDVSKAGFAQEHLALFHGDFHLGLLLPDLRATLSAAAGPSKQLKRMA